MTGRFRLSYSPQYILANLEFVDLIDDRYKAALHEHKEAILPSLKLVAVNHTGRQGMNACCILLELGEIAGTRGLVERVQGADREGRRMAMERLAHLPFHSGRGGIQVPLDKEAVFAAVLPHLQSPDKWIADLALQILEKLRTPEADAVVTKLVDSPNPGIRMSVARWLGWQGLDQGALDAVEDLLFVPNQDRHLTHWLTRTLEDLSAKGSADARQRACNLAIRYIRQSLNRDDVFTANDVQSCLDAVANAAPWHEATVLKQVLESGLAPQVRGSALKRLAALEGPEGLHRLCDALKTDYIRHYAAEGLAELAKNTKDERVIDAIGAMLEKDDIPPSLLAKMATAFVATGGASRAVLRRVMARAEPNTAMMIHWILKGIGLKEASDLLLTTGMAMPVGEDFAHLERQWEDGHDVFNLTLCLMAMGESAPQVMVKTVDPVPDHTETISNLCSVSRGFFDVEDLHQTMGDGGELLVSFVHKGISYTLSADRLGRFVDLPAIMTGLNDILGKTRNKGRFFQIKLDSDMAFVIFALKKEFLQVVRKLRIPLETNHDASRQASVAYTGMC
jgi:hypothetical protein